MVFSNRPISRVLCLAVSYCLVFFFVFFYQLSVIQHDSNVSCILWLADEVGSPQIHNIFLMTCIVFKTKITLSLRNLPFV